MRRRERLVRGERGFTLIEMLAASIIAIFLAGSLSVALWQLNRMTHYNQDSLSLSQQLQIASTLLNRDAVSASSWTVSEGEETKTLTLEVPIFAFGEETDPVTRTVRYTYTSTAEGPMAHTLTRGDDLSGEAPEVVARYLQAIDFDPSWAVSSTLWMTLTAAIHDQSRSMALMYFRRAQDE